MEAYLFGFLHPNFMTKTRWFRKQIWYAIFSFHVQNVPTPTERKSVPREKTYIFYFVCASFSKPTHRTLVPVVLICTHIVVFVPIGVWTSTTPTSVSFHRSILRLRERQKQYNKQQKYTRRPFLNNTNNMKDRVSAGIKLGTYHVLYGRWRW